MLLLPADLLQYLLHLLLHNLDNGLQLLILNLLLLNLTDQPLDPRHLLPRRHHLLQSIAATSLHSLRRTRIKPTATPLISRHVVLLLRVSLRFQIGMLILEECLATLSHYFLEIINEIISHCIERVVCPPSTISRIVHEGCASKGRGSHSRYTSLGLGYDLIHFVLLRLVQIRRHQILLLIRLITGVIFDFVFCLRGL